MTILHENTQTHSLPLGQALRQLPSQYWKVITQPSTRTFAQEKDEASWGSTWLQLITLGIISALLYLLASLISPLQVGNVAGISATDVRTITIVSLAIFSFIATPISFFIAGAILYGVARLFKGNGTYLQQAYTLALFGVPMVIISGLLQLIPATSSWLPFLPHIYSLVLLFFSLQAVHNLSKGRAIAVILLPVGILLLLTIVITILIVALLPR